MRKLIVKDWVDLLAKEETQALIKQYRSLGKGDNQIRLLQYLAAQAPGQALQAKAVSEALGMTPANVRQAGKRLREEIEEWLLHQSLHQRPMLRLQLLTHALQGRGGLELAAQEGVKWEEAIAHAPADMEQLEQMHRHLEWQQHHHATQVRGPQQSSLPALHRQFDLYGLTFRLKTLCAMVAHPDARIRQAAEQDPTHTSLPDSLQSLLDGEAEQPAARRLPVASRTLLQAYLMAYGLFFKAGEEEQLFTWWSLIQQHAAGWNADERQNLYRLFQAYVVRRFNQTGAQTWLQPCLEAYRWGFAQGLETIDHHVPATPLFNYFNLCLRAKDYAQAQSLVELYVPQLHPSEQEHYRQYMAMLLNFAQKKYQDAHTCAQRLLPLKTEHKWEAQLISLKIRWTWEEGEIYQSNRGTALLRNLQYLKGQVTAALKDQPIKPLPIQRRIANFETFLTLAQHPQELYDFYQELSQSPTYLGRDWLMDQAEALLNQKVVRRGK
jgi:hypothetical protein